MFVWTISEGMTISFYCVRSLVPDLGCIPKEAFFSCFGESVFVPFPCCAWPQIHSWFWYVWVVIFHLDSWPTNFFLYFSMWATCAYNEKGTFWWCWPKYTANVVHLRKRLKQNLKMSSGDYCFFFSLSFLLVNCLSFFLSFSVFYFLSIYRWAGVTWWSTLIPLGTMFLLLSPLFSVAIVN